MFKTVLNGDCFIRENVQSLKRMGICSFCIAAVTALRLFLYLTPAVLITILVFVIAGLFSLVLSRVFDAAVTYKLENDLRLSTLNAICKALDRQPGDILQYVDDEEDVENE